MSQRDWNERAKKAFSDDPDLKFALEVDDAYADPVRVLVAVRGVGTALMTIPAANYDPFKLMEMVNFRDPMVLH